MQLMKMFRNLGFKGKNDKALGYLCYSKPTMVEVPIACLLLLVERGLTTNNG